jgi:Kef-type K+ transport system membrane component KefB
VLAVTAIAVVTKFIGAFVGGIRDGRAQATLIAWGMVPRGEVGIVVAGLGLQIGAIDGELYTVVVAMAIITTLIVPPLLPALVRRTESTSKGNPARDEEAPPRRTGEGP